MERAFISSRRKPIKASKKLRTSPVAQIFVDLKEKASISEKDLCSYLDVSDKTLRTWRTVTTSGANSTKLLRLRRIQEVVNVALGSDLNAKMIRQLLVAPLDTSDTEQKSITDIIRNEPDTKFFTQIVHMLVENFKGRQRSPGHFTLSNEDFDRFASDIQSESEPSEAVLRARERFIQLNKAEKLK